MVLTRISLGYIISLPVGIISPEIIVLVESSNENIIQEKKGSINLERIIGQCRKF